MTRPRSHAVRTNRPGQRLRGLWRSGPLLGLMAIEGCLTNWKAQDVAPAQLLQSTGETEVQVRFVNGGRLVVRDPAIEGDSLVGWQLTTTSQGAASPVRRAFALADVQQLATRGNNVAPNVILGAATGFAAFVASVFAIYIIVCSASCD